MLLEQNCFQNSEFISQFFFFSLRILSLHLAILSLYLTILTFFPLRILSLHLVSLSHNSEFISRYFKFLSSHSSVYISQFWRFSLRIVYISQFLLFPLRILSLCPVSLYLTILTYSFRILSLQSHKFISHNSEFSSQNWETELWPWTTKPVISRWGIFVAIAKNALYGSKLLIFFYAKIH